MVLHEVLQLDKTQGSIKKIDLFLVSCVKLSDEYVIALAYKAIILHKIGKTNEALKLLFTMVPSFKEMGVEGIIAICDGIIDICLELARYDQVTKYIKIKQNYLPISKAVLHIKDNIKYYLAIKKYDDAKEELVKYLNDDVTLEESIYAKEELSKIYLFEHQYERYLEVIKDLESYYQSNLSLNKLAELGLNKLKIDFELGNYLKVIKNGNIYIKDDTIKPEQRLITATILLKSYLYSNDYKRASIIESEYYDLINEDDKENSLEFCYAALDLYTKTNTLVSINEYKNKIKSLEALKKEIKDKKKKPQKEQDVVIPVINEGIEDELEEEKKPIIYKIEGKTAPVFNQKLNKKVEQIRNVTVSENYEKLEAVFNTISELDLNVKFREIYRTCCIKLCELFPIDEVYILYYKKQYLGLHYKMGRAYDKKLEFDSIENTFNYMAMNYSSEVFLDLEDDSCNINIVNNKIYDEDVNGIAFPLTDSLKTLGSISFISKQCFLDKELVYEALKLISAMLNTRLLMSLHQDDLEFNHKKLYFVNNNMSSGLKEEMNGFIHFSPQACKILGVLENMVLEDFYYKIKTTDLIHYRRIQDELYTLLSEGVELEYDFKKDNEWIRVKERFYPMVYDGTIVIVSLIDDITDIEKSKNELINLAYKNPISKLDTEVKLMVDLNQMLPNRRLSLAVIDIVDFKIYRELYGYNFANQLVFAVGKELVIALEADFNSYVYHLESDRYVVVFNDINDKRIIDSKLNTILRKVSDALFKLNSRVKLSFYAGVYRLARHSSVDEPSKILYYALDALDDAKNLDYVGNRIAHFDSDLHKKKFNENHLITHISESIDHGKLGLTYRQIINLNDNTVFAYNIVLNLDNFEVDYSYMDFVIRRRGLTIQLEKYAIFNLYKELKMFKEEVKGYITCFVNVSKPTLDEAFVTYINTQQEFFKVPKEYVVLLVDDANHQVLKHLREDGYKIASSNIVDVYNEYCDYFMFDYKKFSDESRLEIKQLCIKHNCECIYNRVDNKEDVDYARENNVEVIYGDYYKKAIRIKSLIEKLSS